MSALRLGRLPDGSRHVVILEPAVGRTSFSRGAISGGAIVATPSWRDRLNARKNVDAVVMKNPDNGGVQAPITEVQP